ncbi:MAG: phosphoglycerate mutase family protein [Chloroflexota bacterium]|nr:phosphoglycerate mutase family protein [Chloroflexota bacterium]
MRSILLVRHAEPLVVPHQKASTWRLTDAGRATAWELAASLVDDHLGIVVTSQERKARETGEVIACALGLTVREHEGLGEQGGDSVEFISNRDVFRETVRQHFGESSRIPLGQESAIKAGARFASVVADLSDQVSPPRCPILVSHGRVMASFLALATGADAWTIWNDFMMPDAIAVDLDSGTIHRLVTGN